MIPIIKIVGNFCNCRCDYCFYHAKDQSIFHTMSDELLERFIEQYMELFSGQLTFIWHGGEPLLAGLNFFQKIINIQSRNLRDGQSIRNHVQTNGILIDDRWAEFLRVHNFRVGISLDGNRESHNRFRKDKMGRRTFDRVMRGIEILRGHDIEPGIIQTITRDSIKWIKDDFDFFTNNLKINGWGINVYFDQEKVNENMLGQNVTTEDLSEFLINYIDLWFLKDDSNLRIREIENFISGIFEKMAPNCTFNGLCTSYFCLDYDGKIYPCDRLSDSFDYSFGDLSKRSILEILNGTRRLKYAKNVNFLHADCAICEWQKACHNGCSAQRIGSLRGKYYYCEARKKIFEYLGNKVENLNEKTAQAAVEEEKCQSAKRL